MPLAADVFRDQFEVFRTRIARATPGAAFQAFDKGLAQTWEGYKGPLRDTALKRLDASTWRREEIGAGRILEATISAIEITKANGEEPNNLVRWEGRFGHGNRSHRRLLEARKDPLLRHDIETVLFEHFREEADPATSFQGLITTVGGRYDLLAYLFFLRDWDRFMPIATRTFDDALGRLGFDLVTSYNASWENYQAYGSALAEIRDALVNVAGVPAARLVDAHSFCWILVRPEMEDAAATRPGSSAKRDPGRTYSARDKSIYEMASGAENTARSANGQIVETTKKNKELQMSRLELEAYLRDLLDLQENCCALTGLPLQFQGDHDDVQLLPSLDRIDSDGHYARGNLQVVCRFVNKWKSNTVDDEFRRLLELVRGDTH